MNLTAAILKQLEKLVVEYGSVKFWVFTLDEGVRRRDRQRLVTMTSVFFRDHRFNSPWTRSCFSRRAFSETVSAKDVRKNLQRMRRHDVREGLYIEPQVLVRGVGLVQLKGWRY